MILQNIFLVVIKDSVYAAANDKIWGWTPTGGRLSSIIHQMKAKNLRIQKLRGAETEKLYKWRYRTVSMETFLNK